MKYKILGKTGIKVSEMSLGTMTFGTDWGWGADKAESQKMFDIFLKHGGNFIDTANIYTKQSSETFLGEFIQTERKNSKTQCAQCAKTTHKTDHHTTTRPSPNEEAPAIKPLNTQRFPHASIF